MRASTGPPLYCTAAAGCYVVVSGVSSIQFFVPRSEGHGCHRVRSGRRRE